MVGCRSKTGGDLRDVHVQQDSEGLNFERALGTLRRRAPLILLCFILAAAAAFGVSKRQTKKYTATASLVFGTSSLSQQIAGLSTTGGSGGSLTQQTNNVELVGGGRHGGQDRESARAWTNRGNGHRKREHRWAGRIERRRRLGHCGVPGARVLHREHLRPPVR